MFNLIFFIKNCEVEIFVSLIMINKEEYFNKINKQIY